MKFAVLLISCLIAALPLKSYAVKVQNPEEMLRVGIYQNKPKVFLDEDGNPEGFWVDLLEHIADAEDWSLEYVPCQWERCLQAVKQGQLDLMMDVAYSEERERLFDFNQEVVLASWSVVYARSGLKLDSVLDLEQKRIAVLKGSIQYTTLAERTKTFGIKPQFIEVNNFHEMFRLLDRADVDAGVVNRFFGQAIASQYQVEKTHILISPARIHFIFPKGKHSNLRTAIDRQLRKLTADSNSAYYQALEYWLEPDGRFGWVQIKHILIDLMVYVPIAGLIVVLVWNHFLNKEVKLRKLMEARLLESEYRFRRAIENAPFPIMIHAEDGEVLQINHTWTELTGYTHQDIPTTQAWTQRAYGERAATVLNEVIAKKYSLKSRWKEGEFTVTTCDGNQRIWEFNSAPLGTLPDERRMVISMAADVTERKQAEADLQESEQRFRNMAANVPGAIFRYVLHPDGSDRVIYMSPGCYNLWEVEAEVVIKDAQILWDVIHPDDRPAMYESVMHSARKLQPWFGQWRITTPSGKMKWLEAAGCPEPQDNGDVVWDTLIMDISARIKAEHKLKHDALHDSLTGLPNRNLLMERLELAFKRAKRHPEYQFALLFLDLDNFKVINDSMGHLIGDELLLAVVTRLNKFIRETDLAARLGGDEFVILLEELDDIEEAVRVAERILEFMRSPFRLNDREVFTSTSIGIVVGSTSYQSAEDLLRDADLAMYRAKQSGRGQYAIFDPAMQLQVKQRLHLENDLRKALENDEFTLYYQPIFDLETDVIQGFETLIRWQHPQRGFVSPGEFIAIAEETELIAPMGHWILHTASQQLASWQAQFPAKPLRISINLSVKQLQSSLLQQLEEVLATYNLQNNSLGLEITESMLVQNVEVTRRLLEQIKAEGICLSIDDFGTGYSSLSYLNQLPVDTLKIDRTFVSPAATDIRNQVIAESVIALSNALGLKAIAEGIETPQQLQWLKGLDCELGQGFLFSPPVTAAQATELLKQSFR